MEELSTDDYETPELAWNMLLSKIDDKNIRIYEPFYCNGLAKTLLNKHGFNNVIHEPSRCFFNNCPASQDYDVIFTNPPYSNLRQVFAKLRELDKPFAVLVPLLVLATQYFQNSVEDMSKLQIIIPKKRLGFIRAGIQIRRGNFDTVWLCYGLNLDFGFIDYH